MKSLNRTPHILIAIIAVAASASAPATAGGLSIGPPQGDERIQPGAAMVSETDHQCTLNWVFRGTKTLKGRLYIGTAAHCVEHTGETVTLQTQPQPLGQPLYEVGTVAYISDTYDFALIEIYRRNETLVDPAMRGHPDIPQGISTTDTASPGDLVQLSGHGLGFYATEATREQRAGILHTISTDWWSAAVPAVNGDSGGPVADVTDGNKALGVVDVLCVGNGDCKIVGGVPLDTALRDAANNGFRVRLVTTD